MTLGELFLEFFFFYRYRNNFDHREQAIDISSPKPFVSKENIQDYYDDYFDRYPILHNIHPEFLEKIQRFTFMIVDPFDKSYNPGKALEIGSPKE